MGGGNTILEAPCHGRNASHQGTNLYSLSGMPFHPSTSKNTGNSSLTSNPQEFQLKYLQVEQDSMLISSGKDLGAGRWYRDDFLGTKSVNSAGFEVKSLNIKVLLILAVAVQ